MSGRLIHILTASALAISLAGGITTSSQAMPLPVTSVQEIAGTAPTEQVRWWGGWGGWGWRRPNYGGAIAAGAIAGGLLGLAASAGSYYGYGYPSYYGYGYSYGYYPSSYAYPGYSYGYYPSSYAYTYPSSYSYPSYYGASYYDASYGLGYRNVYWASGKRGHKHARKPVHR